MSADDQRKLAAIMFTDMVGYSALSQRDEKLAQELLEEHRRLLREIFPRFNGTEIKTIGDAFLVEFGSALEAAQCAIEIQRTLAKRDADASADRQIQVRIGIHIGDVVHRGGDVYGDGVNIASRIEPLADAGGICVSMDVERQIRNAVETRFEKLAPTELKNISVAMDLFRIVLPWERQTASAAKSEIRSERQSGSDKSETARLPWHEIVIGILLLAALIGGFILWFHRPGPGEKTTSENPVAATPSISQKSIAVLPFENLSSDKENAYFTDGVQDEILTDLAKLADLKVISRSSVMQYKSGVARNLRKISEELGVAHVLEGSVQRAANKVRVNAQLIDARNDRHEWAENYDRPIDDVFAIQSEIAKAIADQLQAKLSPNEKASIGERPTADVVAFEQYSKAKTLMLISGGRVYREAVELLKSATARDPAFHAAFCQLVLANDRLYAQGYDHTPERLSAAEEALKKAAELRPDSAETHLARAQHLYYTLRDYNGTLSELDLARQGLPNDPRAVELTGYILRRRGKMEEGLRAMQQGASLDPRDILVLQQISNGYASLRRYAEAAATYDRALQIKPDDLLLLGRRSGVDVSWRADPGPECRLVERVRREQPAFIKEVADSWFDCALLTHDWAGAEQALAVLGDDTFWGDGPIKLNGTFAEGLLARVRHDDARARRAFTAARVAQEQIVQKQKDYAPALCTLGLIDAALGNKQAALEEGRRAIELLPISKDAVDGPTVSAYFALIAAWTGEKDLAIEQLRTVVQPGVYANACTDYGTLKLYPFWDPLRGDPRFEKIVSSLAPKGN
jgi:TolB-like protein/class 3 adenylate cyclase